MSETEDSVVLERVKAGKREERNIESKRKL